MAYFVDFKLSFQIVISQFSECIQAQHCLVHEFLL